jgi:DNA-binding response OmpR family regulator
MMPGMDGFALLHAIRADETLAWTPVVLVTARAGEESAIQGLLAGSDDYVVKPFSARELLARVGASSNSPGCAVTANAASVPWSAPAGTSSTG